MRTKNREIKTIFAVVVIVFGIFLAYPMIRLLLKSFIGDTGATTAFYHAVLTEKGIVKAIINSFKVAGASALLTTILAFFMAYTVHYSNAPGWGKKVIHVAAVLPMFLPTLTYGFAIIYSFGKQGC